MAIRYVFDTSAFAKLIIQEPETQIAQEYYKQAQQVAASRLVPVEFESALQRRIQENHFTSEKGKEISQLAQQVLSSLLLLSVDGSLPLAQTLLQTAGPLKTLDAIHLATAKMLGAPFVVFDRQLRQAAVRAGIQVLPPTEPRK